MAQFIYSGSARNIPDFEFPSLYDFIQDTRRRLQQPLTLPEYAVAYEEEPMQKVTEIIEKDPYRLRIEVNERIRQFGERFQKNTLRPVSYKEYPRLYRAAQFTMATAKQFANLDVLIQVYRANQGEDIYQAMALGYLDRTWLFISEHFFLQPNFGMLQDEEICFLLGHELGHAQCWHNVISMLTGQDIGSNGEYSADRAGLIVCANWLLANRPGTDVKTVIHQAVLSSVATLDKSGLAYKDYYQWNTYDYGELAGRLQAWLDHPGKLPPDGTSHPSDEHRALALYHFSQSEMLWRLLGLESEKGLLTDSQLQQFMNTLLKK